MTEREKLAAELERLSKLSVAGEWTFEEHLDGILSIETAEPKLYDREDVCQIGFDRTTRLKAESFAKLVIAMRNNLPAILAALRADSDAAVERAAAELRQVRWAGPHRSDAGAHEWDRDTARAALRAALEPQP